MHGGKALPITALIKGRFLLIAGFGALLMTFVAATQAHAATANDSFALQLTPSPLVQTVKPGVTNSFPLQVRNNGTGNEDLKIEVRRFTFNSDTGQIAIDDVPAADLSQWVTFSNARFSVAPGQVFTQNVKIAFPADSGFSYSFVIVISRQSQPQATGGGRLLQGTIADFGLVNIDRPGATSALQIASLKTSAGIYEYVPATLSLTFKNTGNTFVRPTGNIFIGRGDDAGKHPITTLPVNDAGGYILPDTSRTISANWNDGFPRIDTETLSDGTVKKHEIWNWGDLSKFRFGKYTAQAVAVYSNGSYDVPLNAQVSFWILPWKIILGALIILLIVGFGVFTIIRSFVRGIAGGRRRIRR